VFRTIRVANGAPCQDVRLYVPAMVGTILESGGSGT
jgi:hypothetical protein